MFGVIGGMILKTVGIKLLRKATKVIIKASDKDVTIQEALKEEVIVTLRNLPNEITDVAVKVEHKRRKKELKK